MATKSVAKVKPLKRLNVPVAPEAAEEADKIAVVTLRINGEAVRDYVEADAQVKAWEKIKGEKRPDVQDAGLVELYRYNCATSHSPVKTVKVVDGTGSACNVTLADTYGKAQLDPTTVITQLAGLGKTDPNVFVAEKVAIKFDTSVFYDADGNLRENFYVDVLKAMFTISEKYGVNSPFISTTVVSPKDGLAEKRWSEFKVEQQAAVSKVFPATVTLKPVAPAANPE
jgi:hypothetical protein